MKTSDLPSALPGSLASGADGIIPEAWEWLYLVVFFALCGLTIRYARRKKG